MKKYLLICGLLSVLICFSRPAEANASFSISIGSSPMIVAASPGYHFSYCSTPRPCGEYYGSGPHLHVPRHNFRHNKPLPNMQVSHNDFEHRPGR